MKLGEIASKLGCALTGDANLEISGVIGIDEAGPGQITFVSNPKYASKARTTRASAVIVQPDFPEIPAATLRIANPYLAFAKAIELFYRAPEPAKGVSASAQVAPSAKIGPNAAIGPFVAIGNGVVIGANATIHPFVNIADGVSIGDNFKAYAHASVREHCRIGNNVTLQDGAKVGTDGFGYAKQEDGAYYKIVQSGIVVIEDDVEIGANATIDRATIGETRIRRGAKIDNLVQIGHGSTVGENTLLCAQVGLGGSSKIGRDVILTGQVGVAGHLEVGDRVVATAQSGIPNSVEAGQMVSGYPAIENRLWLKCSALFKRLPELFKRVDAIEKKSGKTDSQ